MSRKRLPAAARRTEILAAARRAYAKHGLNASSLQIAAEAGVSDALIFRHFSTKEALSRAVLRDLIQDQNTAYEAMGLTERGAKGLVHMLILYFRACLAGLDTEHSERVRILAGNLANQGDYARLAYRRAVRQGRKPLEQALEEARADGDVVGYAIAAPNIIMYLEHLGSNVHLATASEDPIGAYDGSAEEQLQQLVWMAGRGLGLTEAAIERNYNI